MASGQRHEFHLHVLLLKHWTDVRSRNKSLKCQQKDWASSYIVRGKSEGGREGGREGGGEFDILQKMRSLITPPRAGFDISHPWFIRSPLTVVLSKDVESVIGVSLWPEELFPCGLACVSSSSSRPASCIQPVFFCIDLWCQHGCVDLMRGPC